MKTQTNRNTAQEENCKHGVCLFSFQSHFLFQRLQAELLRCEKKHYLENKNSADIRGCFLKTTKLVERLQVDHLEKKED